MIPIALLPGVLIGRWWFVPVAAAAWVALIVAVNGVDLAGTPIAAGLAMAKLSWASPAANWPLKRSDTFVVRPSDNHRAGS
jgi:hypothetical protein